MTTSHNLKGLSLFLILFILNISFLEAQTGNVGINTDNPKVTLDIVGAATNVNKPDGVVAPRLTGDQLHDKTNYGEEQNGAFVYVTTKASNTNQTGKTKHVKCSGYYYYNHYTDGGMWIPFVPCNNKSSGGSSIIINSPCSSYTNGFDGMMTKGAPAANVTMHLWVEVTQLGTWHLTTAEQNGVTFSGNGEFTDLGCHEINLAGNGTFTNEGTFTWATTSTPSYSADGTVESDIHPSTNGTGIIHATIPCTGHTNSFSGGAMTEGQTSTNIKMHVWVNVTQIGTWNMSATQAGVTFSGSGNFTTTGCQEIILNANGNTFASAGSTTWSTNTNPIHNATCTIGAASPPPLPHNLTLVPGQIHYLASCYDQNYLPISGYDANAATTGTLDPDGINELKTINIQGTLTTTGVIIKIPYTVIGSNTVNLPAFSQFQTVASEHVQGNNPNSTAGGGAAVDVELSWEAQSLPPGNGTINATLKSIDNNLNSVKLDINLGVGNDLGLTLAAFTIATDETGTTGFIKLKDIAPIPDRAFDNDANHQFLYLPITGEDSKVWLNNNLGADYANINHSSFNPTQQATSKSDYHAYGSLYQWGRLSDGHELITWSGMGFGTPVSDTTFTLSTTDTPPNAKFIVAPNLPRDWRSPKNPNLWQGISGINNPCPKGFRLPTGTEWLNYRNAASITNSTTAAAKELKLSTPGRRGYNNGSIWLINTWGYYWSSTAESGGTQAFYIGYDSGTGEYYRAYGLSVRCIKD